jgi:hypothetical protein
VVTRGADDIAATGGRSMVLIDVETVVVNRHRALLSDRAIIKR